MRPAGVLGRCPGVMSEINIIVSSMGNFIINTLATDCCKFCLFQMVLFLLDALGINVVAKRLRCAEVLFLPITYELPDGNIFTVGTSLF